MTTTITIYKTQYRKPLLGLLPLWLVEVDDPERNIHETNIPTPWLLNNPVETVIAGLRQSNPNADIRVRG